jgi:Ca2+/Na+ antiporter
MSGGDKVLLWLHVAAVMFLLGPLTIATTTTPRYIRSGDVSVLRHLHRTTRIFGLGSLLVFVFGAALGRNHLDKPWLTASMTLFIVAVILLVIVERDQRKTIGKLEANDSTDSTESTEAHRGRIVALSSTVGVIWLVVLALMIWRPGN